MAVNRFFIIVIICSVLGASQPLCAQVNLTEENADCYGAVIIRDSVFGPVFPGRGHGHVLEIRDNAEDDPMYLEKEHHSIWYKFRVPWDCDLQFDIIPEDQRDDIDFMLFRGAIVDICEDIYSRKHKPIRSNIGRNDPAIGSRSGLSVSATEDFVQSGPSDQPYSRSVAAKKGELFYLLVDQLSEPRGPYTIFLHYGPQPVEEIVDEGPQQLVKINMIDKDTRLPVAASVAVEGVKLGELLKLEGETSYEFKMKAYRSISLSAVKKDFLLYEQRVKASSDSIVELTLEMTALRTGTVFRVDNIKFVGNQDRILRSSFKAVKQIEFFMKENKAVRIEIQGHVNGPTMKNTRDIQKLSDDRAKAVFEHLALAGIRKDRMEYQGYGNTQMLFPKPKNSKESESNRRVEIKILENAAFQEEAVAETLPPSAE